MLKVLLVDDEPIIISGLKKLIQWNELGLQLAGEAFDGEEALNLVAQHRPDIIITDLLMPGTDGIQFIRNMKEAGYGGRIIILSGHDKFEYAREALKSNVFEYLLKPVTASQLADTLRMVRAEIVEENNRRKDMERLEAKLRESLPVLREKFFWELFCGELIHEREIHGMLTLLDIDLTGEGYVMLCVELENLYEILSEQWEKEVTLLRFAIRNLVEELAGMNNKSYVTLIGNRIHILLVEEKQQTTENIFSLSSVILENLKKYLNVSASIGIGRKVETILQIKNSFDDSREALKHKFFRGVGSVIHINEASFSGSNDKLDHSVETEILENIRYGIPMSGAPLARKLITQYRTLSGNQIDLIYTYCYEFCIQLRKILDVDELVRNPLPRADRLYHGITANTTEAALEKWLSRQLELSFAAVNEAKKIRENDVIAESKAYIDKHYSEQITLNVIASKAYMSPTYFCTLFKTRLGIGFHDYLMKVRMEIAAKLISSQSYRIYEVSEQVGYKNPRYFSEAFKRYYGVIPTEYKV